MTRIDSNKPSEKVATIRVIRGPPSFSSLPSVESDRVGEPLYGLTALEGETISLPGTITEFKGKPPIEITAKEAISEVKN